MNSERRPLDGRVALVTGASRGIGAATARALAAAGARVALAARDAEALRGLADELTANGNGTMPVPTDVSDTDSVRRMVDGVSEEYGRLDIVVNSAASANHRPTRLVDVDVEDFDSALLVNLRGAFLVMKYAVPAMLRGDGGAVVNIASTAGLQATGGLAGYVSSKFGLVGLTRSAALDYAESGVRVNALAPGPIRTEPLLRAGERAQRQAALAMPMRRTGTPEEVAGAAVWLCSDDASFITGATLPVDGGKLAGLSPFPPSSP